MRYALGVVDTELETRGAPLNQVEGRLGLERSSGSTAITRNNITTIEESDGHVLSVAWVADNHLVVGLKAWSKSANVQDDR